MTVHEDLGRKNDVKMGSERGFGFVFAAVFAIIGLWPLIGGEPVRIWALGVAVAFVAVALIYPRALRPLNILWFRFGLLLYKITSPIVMAVMYYIAVVPVGLLMKVFAKDPLQRKFDPNAKSYWIDREPPGPEPESMKRQF
jgi:predicted membrane metal-binding protein